MKKLLGISVIAMLAVAPAFASVGDPVGTGTTPTTASPQPSTAEAKAAMMATGLPFYELAKEAATDGNAASAGYVKGAYNAAIKAINKVNETVNSNLAVTGGNGIDKTNGVISVDLTDKGGLQMDGSTDGSKTLGVNTGNGLQKNASTGAVEVKAANNSISVTSSGVAVTVDGSTVEVDSTNGVQVKNGGITAAKLATDSVETAKIKDSNVTTAKIADGNVTAAKLATDSVTTAKIANENVTLAKIASGAIQNGSAQGAANDKLTTKDYVDEAIAGLGTSYATKTGVEATIKNTTLTQGAVTQGLTGALGTGTIVTIMTSWGDDTTSTNVTGVTGIGTLDTDVSVAAPTITANSVEYSTTVNP